MLKSRYLPLLASFAAGAFFSTEIQIIFGKGSTFRQGGRWLWANRQAFGRTMIIDIQKVSTPVAVKAGEYVGQVLEDKMGTSAPAIKSIDVSTGQMAFAVVADHIEVDARVWSTTTAMSSMSITLHASQNDDLVPLVEAMSVALHVDYSAVGWTIVKRQPGVSAAAEFFDTNDLERHMLAGGLAVWRRRLTNVNSKYQNIQIWASDDHGPLLEGQQPSKILYLDGVTQSSTNDEHIYHESLVHPGMIAHPTGAKRVAILGGGEGATLRESLKYSTVTEVAMIELDKSVVNEALKHLKQLNNCSWTSPNYKSCYDDPRAKLITEDCVKWFRARFGSNPCNEPTGQAKFDVIIMDLLDPEFKPATEFAKWLYSEEQITELSCALNDDGVFIAQIGEAPLAGVDEELTSYAFKGKILDTIASHFSPQATFVYEVEVPSFTGAWNYVVACKSQACAERWYQNPAFLDRSLDERLVPEARSTLLYFDGAVMQSFARPTEAWDQLQCSRMRVASDKRRAFLTPCDKLDKFGTYNAAPPENFAARSKDGVIAVRDIAAGEILAPWRTDAALIIPRAAYIGIQKLSENDGSSTGSGTWQIARWLQHHGTACQGPGGGHFIVSLRDDLPFVPAGCLKAPPNVALFDNLSSEQWNPGHARRFLPACTDLRATVDIKKGTRIRSATKRYDWDSNGKLRDITMRVADAACAGQ